MGLVRLLVHPSGQIIRDAAESAYIAGFDLVPRPCQIHLTDDQLVIEKVDSYSAALYLPLYVPGHGPLMLSTGTLIEREKPYLLSVEVARGTLYRLRNQMAEWQISGEAVDEEVARLTRRATHFLAEAATRQQDVAEASSIAEKSLDATLEAAHRFCRDHIEHALADNAVLRADPPTLGVNLGQWAVPDDAASEALSQVFQTAMVSLAWQDVECESGDYQWQRVDQQLDWCERQGLKVLGGPLIQLDDRGLPSWLSRYSGGFENRIALATDYLETLVNRYRGRIDRWVCATRIGGARQPAMPEEQVLKLAVRSIEVVRQLAPDHATYAFFDQPWSEGLTRSGRMLTPLHVADALARSGLGVTGFGLELNFGETPAGSRLRLPLELSRLLNCWSGLDLPLIVSMSIPSGQAHDAASAHDRHASAAGDSHEPLLPDDATLDSAPADREEREPPSADRAAEADPRSQYWTPRRQRDWAESLVGLALTKPAVESVLWNQPTDAVTHDDPHAGLFDAAGQPKEVLEALAQMREKYLP